MEALTSIEKRKGFVKVEDLRYYTYRVQFQPGHALKPADLLNVTAINMRRKYVNQYLNYPINVRHDIAFPELGKTYLIFAHKTRNNRRTQTSGYTDTESTYHAADGNIPNHIFASISWV